MASRQQFRLRPFDIGYLFPALVVLCALTPTVLSLPVESGTVQNANSNPTVLVPRQASNASESYYKDCGFDGDQDMYGLGIRIGYYVQWVATVFGAYFTPQIVSSAFEANAIFNIGMLAGLVFSTIRREDMYVVEPVLVLGFSIGGAIVGLLDPKNYHVANDIHSLQSRLFHLCGTGALSVPLLVYWTWYSFYGMDTLNYNHCAESTFFIVKIHIWAPWFRYFMKVATVMSLIGLIILAIFAIVTYRKKASIPKQERLRRYSTMFQLQRSQSLTRLSTSDEAMTERARPTGVQFFVVIVVCLVCALSVEFGIIWNKITGINALGATGQLIPMAIGIITSIRVFLGIISQHIKSRKHARKMADFASFFGMGGDVIEVMPKRSSRPMLGLAASDIEQGKDEVLVLESLVDGGAGDRSGKGQFRRSSTTNMTEKPKFSPASTSDSHGTTIGSLSQPSNKSVRSMKSVKSNKSGKLTKERRGKGKEIEMDDSISVMTLPREPAAAVTRGTVSSPSVITTGSGRKKLHRDSNRKNG